LYICDGDSVVYVNVCDELCLGNNVISWEIMTDELGNGWV